ncbi:MAG: MFS transporter, partial [Acidimicrobiales bacterium]
FLPVLLFGAWAGVIADRVDKRRLMLVTQTAMMTFAFVLGLLVLTDTITLPMLFVLAGLTGLATAFDNPARRVMVTELVDEDDLANAVGLNSALVNGSKIMGPAVAGFLASTVGVGWCFAVNGLSFLAVLTSLTRMDTAEIHRSTPLARGRGQIREGLRYVWSEPDLRIPVLLTAVVATLAFNFHVLVPLLATRDLSGGTGTYTLITSIMSVGSLTGSLWIARRRAVDSRFLALSAAALGVASMLFAMAPSVLLACVLGAATGASAMVFLNGSMTALQLGARPAMRGRVMALFTILFLGSTPIGGPLLGWIAEDFGARVALGFGAAASMTVGIVALVALNRRAGRLVRPAAPEPAFAGGTAGP